MITQSATVTITATTQPEWDTVKAKLPQVVLPQGSEVHYDDMLKAAVITVPASEVKL